MPTSPVEQIPATAGILRRLLAAGELTPAAYERALVLAGITPDLLAWRRFIDRLLIFLGTVLILAGVVFFFAYNWADLHKFGKFGLLQTVLVLAVATAWHYGLDTLAGKAALLAAALLPGVLLAVYGQVYQTGADSWTLFFGWGLLIAGWVAIGRLAALWLLLLVLANAALMLYANELWWPGDYRSRVLRVLESAWVLNTAALIACEGAGKQGIDWIVSARWLARLIALFALAAILVPALAVILAGDAEFAADAFIAAAPLFYVIFTGTAFGYYLVYSRDLSILALLMFGAIVVISVWLARRLPEAAGTYLFIGLIVIGLSSAAAILLRRIAQWWEQQP
jgi:uncharacterized membrane protein